MNPESILKGRMAEALVCEILREAGNQVYNFGYEAVLQNLTQVDKVFDRHSEIGKKIRDIPDLLVINEKGEPFFVEVKFRWHQDWHENDFEMLDRLNKFWQPIIVFVNCYSRPYFLAVKPPYCNRRTKKLSGWPLEKTNYFNIPKQAIEKYNVLVEKYLSPTLTHEKNKK